MGAVKSFSTPKHELSFPARLTIDPCSDRRQSHSPACQTHSMSALSSRLKLFRVQLFPYLSMFAGNLPEECSRQKSGGRAFGSRNSSKIGGIAGTAGYHRLKMIFWRRKRRGKTSSQPNILGSG